MSFHCFVRDAFGGSDQILPKIDQYSEILCNLLVFRWAYSMKLANDRSSTDLICRIVHSTLKHLPLFNWIVDVVDPQK